jgi:hypothetical protein
MIIVTRLHGASLAVYCDAFRASVVLLAGRLDEPEATGQHLYLVPTPDPDG